MSLTPLNEKRFTMLPYLVADIGGTNARFALVTDKNGDQFAIEHIQILSGAEYPRFEDALKAYLQIIPDSMARPKSVCVAIAGPIGGDMVSMTNLPSYNPSSEVTDLLDSLDVLWGRYDAAIEAGNADRISVLSNKILDLTRRIDELEGWPSTDRLNDNAIIQ